MTSFYISLFVFCIIGVGGYALYLGLYGGHRALEERFADLAIQIRASQGVFDDDDERRDFRPRGIPLGGGTRPRPRRREPHRRKDPACAGAGRLWQLSLRAYFSGAPLFVPGGIRGCGGLRGDRAGEAELGRS